MDYKKIEQQLRKLVQVYEKICNDMDVDFQVEPPATESEIQRAEQQLNVKLPVEIRDFFLKFSKNCELNAYLPDSFELPDELCGIFSATFRISLDEIVEAELSRGDWQTECFPDEEDEYDRVWHNKLGLMTVGNGDVIALDIGSDSGEVPVVYLSHEGDESHGCILGKTFNDYFEALILVGACGNEDWQILPFCNDMESGIDPNCENAKTYRRLIGLEW